ncbi:MAG: hypothetical protein M1813_007469 [Trichoglossum hirsutum]|nr:MAG: hypothetical protein M1813_007469 [Trichoglossum hirsutum]
MHFGRQLLLLFGAWFAISSAHYVDVLRNSLNPSPVLAARAPTPSAGGEDDAGTCRAKCSYQNLCCWGPLGTRDLQPRYDPSPANLEAYVLGVTNDPGTIQVYDAVTHMVDSAGFTALGGANPAVNIGLKDLCGCTGLFIINPLGIYYAHYFESPSFDDDVNFQSNVLDFLRDLTGARNGFPSLVPHIGILNSPNTRIFINTPKEETRPRTNPQYNDKINALKATLHALLPLAPNAFEYLYRAPDGRTLAGRTLMRTTTRGRALFQYDPANAAPSMRLYFQIDQMVL